jgi:hypothetical protein
MSDMTKQEAALWGRGADSVGGDLMLRNKVVGTYRNGVFALTDDGVAELEIEEVEAVEVKPRAKAPRSQKPTTESPGVGETPLD